jgi:hypothetical protein
MDFKPGFRYPGFFMWVFPWKYRWFCRDESYLVILSCHQKRQYSQPLGMLSYARMMTALAEFEMYRFYSAGVDLA